MSLSHEIEFTVTKATDEVEGHTGANLATGSRGGWLAHSTFGTAYIDVSFGTEFSIHSMTLVAVGCSRLVVTLKSRKGERDNWMGGSAALRGAGATQTGSVVYDSLLPGEECKKYLAARNTGDGLKAVASQEEWTGMRISLTPAAGHETFGLKKLTIDRQPTKSEVEARRAAIAKQATETAQKAAATAAATAAAASAPAFASTSVPLPPAMRPPVNASAQAGGVGGLRRSSCTCGKPGCNGCGGEGKVRCRAHSLLCCLKLSKAAGSKDRPFWACPLERKPGSLPACGFLRWADEAIGHVATVEKAVELPEEEDEQRASAPPPAAAAAAATKPTSAPVSSTAACAPRAASSSASASAGGGGSGSGGGTRHAAASVEEVVSSYRAKLQEMNVKELKAEGTKRNVDLSGCLEKGDLVVHLSAAYAAAKADKLAAYAAAKAEKLAREAKAAEANAKAAEANAKAVEAKAAEVARVGGSASGGSSMAAASSSGTASSSSPLTQPAMPKTSSRGGSALCKRSHAASTSTDGGGSRSSGGAAGASGAADGAGASSSSSSRRPPPPPPSSTTYASAAASSRKADAWLGVAEKSSGDEDEDDEEEEDEAAAAAAALRRRAWATADAAGGGRAARASKASGRTRGVSARDVTSSGRAGVDVGGASMWRDKRGNIVAPPAGLAGGSEDDPMAIDEGDEDTAAAAAAEARRRAQQEEAERAAEEAADDSVTEEEDKDEADSAPLLWPPGLTRCPFDVRCPLRPHGCLRGNPTHLLRESHTVEHVRRQARKVDWAHTFGPLYRLVRDAGLPHAHCTTRDACLRALDTALDTFEAAGARHDVPLADASAGDYAAMAQLVPEPID